MNTIRLLVITWALTFLGCSKAPPKPSAPVPSTDPPITMAEAKRFGQWLEKAIQTRDIATARKMIAYPHFAYRQQREMGVDVEHSKANLRHSESKNFGDNMIKNWMGDDARQDGIKLLHVRTEEGQPHLVFRLTQNQLDYLDMTLFRQLNGEVVMGDFIRAIDGEPESTKYKRFFKEFPLGSEQEKTHDKGVSNVTEMNYLFSQSKDDQAWKIYETLPQDIKDFRSVQRKAIVIAEKANPEASKQLLADFRKKYPDDLSYDLYRLDKLCDDKKCDEAIAIINRLDKKYGPDAYLEYMRAVAYNESNRSAENEQALAAGFKLEPTLPELHWHRILRAVKSAKLDEAVSYLKALADVNVDAVDLKLVETDPRLTALAKSEQYKVFKKWLSERKPK